VRTTFEGVSFGGIVPRGAARCYDPAGMDDGHWCEVAVVIPIAYYELK